MKYSLTALFPILTISGLLIFFLYYIYAVRPREGTTEWITRVINRARFDFFPVRHKMQKRDIAPLILITAVFGVLALLGLGDLEMPVSAYTFTQDTPLVIELQSEIELGELRYFPGLHTGYYTLELSPDGEIWQEQLPEDDNEYAMHQRYSHLFKWRTADINDVTAPVKFIRLTPSRTPLELREVVITDAYGLTIKPSILSDSAAATLFDEQHLSPARINYMNSMYFDEIYHGRTAYEHLRTVAAAANGTDGLVYPYETTHPPLGKLIISLGIAVFGMVPFGWRIAGALFGVFMLPVLYIFVKNMFGKTTVSICAAVLFGVDFMRYTQTRIATIDTYAVFFILLAYFFMYRYVTTPPEGSFRKSALPLFMSGLFFGLGCASKWVVVYAGLGLALIWLIRAVATHSLVKEDESFRFGRYLLKKILLSTVFFVIIPAVIYCASYIPYGLVSNPGISVLWDAEFYKTVWANQESMFSYHAELVAEHPYSSQWWQWITNLRPILYFRDYAPDAKSAFGAFGNPVVWWGGFFAVIAMAVQSVKYRSSKALFILTGYLSQLLPWVFVSRIVFVYHYFPATIFLVLALAHVMNTVLDRAYGYSRTAVFTFTGAAAALFAMFYPAVSGVYMPVWYSERLLTWFPSWPL